MKNKLFCIVALFTFMFSSCALEIANVVGPAKGYVFYDKKSYSEGWRYLECAPINAGEIENYTFGDLTEVNKITADFSYSGYSDWILPDESQLKSMLASFTWDLTRFKDKNHFISSDGTVYGCNFNSSLFGDIIKIDNYTKAIKIRLIRKF